LPVLEPVFHLTPLIVKIAIQNLRIPRPSGYHQTGIFPWARDFALTGIRCDGSHGTGGGFGEEDQGDIGGERPGMGVGIALTLIDAEDGLRIFDRCQLNRFHTPLSAG